MFGWEGARGGDWTMERGKRMGRKKETERKDQVNTYFENFQI